MKFIFGLGNPGEKYQFTRHNIGFIFIEKMAAFVEQNISHTAPQLSDRFSAKVLQFPGLLLLQPQTFMNDSGRSVRAALDFYKQQDLAEVLVAHDDLDIPFGSYKIQLGKGPKIHNGLNSLYAHLHNTAFWHIRLGVDGRAGDRSMPGSAYVLGQFLSTEKEVLDQMLESAVREVVQTYIVQK